MIQSPLRLPKLGREAGTTRLARTNAAKCSEISPQAAAEASNDNQDRVTAGNMSAEATEVEACMIATWAPAQGATSIRQTATPRHPRPSTASNQ